MPSIVFTGGGTAGHVTPNLALIDGLIKENWEIHYMGSNDGIEKNLISKTSVPFHGVLSGKLRRYFSFKNLIDPFKIAFGTIQSFFILKKLKPHVVFSKGGFVAFPVVIGAYLNRIPVISHESDMTPGLANRLCMPFVQVICLTFEAAKSHIANQSKVVVTGTPIRDSLFHGDKQKALELTGFNSDKPICLVMGGSQGSNALNRCIRDALPELLTQFQIIHLCGKGKTQIELNNQAGYFQMEYANEELPDLFSAANLVISRSGANAVCELLALGKPHVFIPLKQGSRGDQVQNAAFFKNLGVSVVIEEEQLTPKRLIETLTNEIKQEQERIERIQALQMKSGVPAILSIIRRIAEKA